MEKAAEILGPALRSLRQPQAALAWLVATWPGLAGERLAVRTRPVRFEGGTLLIAAEGRDWQVELEEMRPEFQKRINSAWGKELVRDVHFVEARPASEKLPREFDNEYKPFLRSRRATRDSRQSPPRGSPER